MGTGAGLAQQMYAALISIAASGTSTLDLSGSLTNLVGDTSIAFTGIKAFQWRLLSVADDATNGTACSSITIGNAASNIFRGPLGATPGGTDEPTYTITSGSIWAAGRGDAGGWTVANASNDLWKITNNDAGVAAAVQLVILGI